MNAVTELQNRRERHRISPPIIRTIVVVVLIFPIRMQRDRPGEEEIAQAQRNGIAAQRALRVRRQRLQIEGVVAQAFSALPARP